MGLVKKCFIVGDKIMVRTDPNVYTVKRVEGNFIGVEEVNSAFLIKHSRLANEPYFSISRRVKNLQELLSFAQCFPDEYRHILFFEEDDTTSENKEINHAEQKNSGNNKVQINLPNVELCGRESTCGFLQEESSEYIPYIGTGYLIDLYRDGDACYLDYDADDYLVNEFFEEEDIEECASANEIIERLKGLSSDMLKLPILPNYIDWDDEEKHTQPVLEFYIFIASGWRQFTINFVDIADDHLVQEK